jgi:hypothetical protein
MTSILGDEESDSAVQGFAIRKRPNKWYQARTEAFIQWHVVHHRYSSLRSGVRP